MYWNKERHLTPHPAIRVTDVDAIIQQVKSSRLKVAYPETLTNLIRLCFECALRAGELTDLSVGDVYNYGRGVVSNSLQVAERELLLSAAAMAIINDQIKHLRRKKHRLQAQAPFYPDKSGKRYGHRLLRYHLLKACPNSRRRVILNEIRQAGICQYYENAKAAGMSPDECLVRTANFAGIKVYQRKNLYPIVKRLLNSRS